MPGHRNDERSLREQIAEILAVTMLEMLIRQRAPGRDDGSVGDGRTSTGRTASRCSPSAR